MKKFNLFVVLMLGLLNTYMLYADTNSTIMTPPASVSCNRARCDVNTDFYNNPSALPGLYWLTGAKLTPGPTSSTLVYEYTQQEDFWRDPTFTIFLQVKSTNPQMLIDQDSLWQMVSDNGKIYYTCSLVNHDANKCRWILVSP